VFREMAFSIPTALANANPTLATPSKGVC
jgi:hypothetical protein